MPERSARSVTVVGPVICQSGAVSPSPPLFTGSLLATLAIAQVAPPQPSAAVVVTVTGTIWWFAGARLVGDAITRVIVGAVVSTTVTAVVTSEAWPSASTTART